MTGEPYRTDGGAEEPELDVTADIDAINDLQAYAAEMLTADDAHPDGNDARTRLINLAQDLGRRARVQSTGIAEADEIYAQAVSPLEQDRLPGMDSREVQRYFRNGFARGYLEDLDA